MQDCAYYEDLCSLALDDELTAAEQAELHAHLAVCPECAAYMEELRGMQRLLATELPEVPSSLHEDIMELVLAQAQEQTRPPERRRIVPMFTMLAAAAAAVMLVTSGTVGNWFGAGGAPMAGGAATAGAPETAAMDAGVQGAVGALPDGAVFSAPVSGDTKPADAGTTDTGTASTADAGAGAANSAPVQAQIAPAQAENKNETAAAAGGEAPAVAPRSATRQAEPPAEGGDATASITSLPDSAAIVLQQQSYAACYVAQGTGKLPEFGGSLVAQSADGKTLYFALSSNLSDQEQVLGELAKAGYNTEKRDDIKDVMVDTKSEQVLLIITQQ